MTGYETKNSRKESVKQSKITLIPPNRWSAVSPHFSFGNAADWIVVHAPPLDAILAARKAGNFVCDVSHLEGQEDWRMPVSGKLWHRRVGSAETGLLPVKSLQLSITRPDAHNKWVGTDVFAPLDTGGVTGPSVNREQSHSHAHCLSINVPTCTTPGQSIELDRRRVHSFLQISKYFTELKT